MQSRHEARFHVLCRAEQFERPHALAADDAVDECVLKENGEPRACDGAAFSLLQLCPHPQDAAYDARDGG